jgi:hypothetical protein
MRKARAQITATSVGPAKCHSLSWTPQATSGRRARAARGCSDRNHNGSPDRCAESAPTATRCRHQAVPRRSPSGRCRGGTSIPRPPTHRRPRRSWAGAPPRHPPPTATCGWHRAHPRAVQVGQVWSGAEVSFRDQAAYRLTTDERNRTQSGLNNTLSQRELAPRLHRSASRSAGRSGAGTMARATTPLAPPDRQAGEVGEGRASWSPTRR